MNNKYNKLGHLYEAFFNIGLLKVLKEELNFLPYWVKELESFPIGEYALNLYQDFGPTELLKRALSRVMFIYETQGYVFGKNLLEDLKNREKPEVFFYYGKPIPIEDDREFFLQRFTEQFGELPEEFTRDEKGSLLHTDLAVHFIFRKKGHYIAIADLSLSGAGKLFGYYEDLNKPTFYSSGLRKILIEDLEQVGNGYLFKPINIKDAGNFKQLLEKLFSLKHTDRKTLEEIFSLLESKNRDVAKLIQACSYAHDYLKLLLQKGIIDKNTPLVLRIFGITLHKVAQISFSLKEGTENIFSFLEKAKEVYSTVSNKKNNTNRFMEKFSEKLTLFLENQKPPVRGITIEKQNLKEYTLSRKKEKRIVFTEKWNIGKDYRLNHPKRLEHEKVLKQVLENSRWIADLGVPGIGKTTTIFKTFNRNSLILYTSPRVFLNKELIKKWVEKNPNMVAFYTQSEQPDTIFYHTQDKNLKLPEEISIPKLGKVRLKQLTDTGEEDEKYITVREVSFYESADRFTGEKGVLNRLLQTVKYFLEAPQKPLKNKEILIAFATQAVLKRSDGGNTFEHIQRFFLEETKNPAFGREKVLKILKNRFISNGIRDIAFVMDEITGSESGRPLFKSFAFQDWFIKLQKLAEKELNLRLYFFLLDASLKGFDIFKTFAEDKEERPVIYLNLDGKVSEKGIETEKVKIKDVEFTCIDAFGFPAASLDLFYTFEPLGDRKKELPTKLTEYIENFLRKGSKQILLFLQDKNLLENLKKNLVKKGILKEDEILVIHSLKKDTENTDKNTDEEKEEPKLILATSSASRGLTYPLIDTYLIVVPDFLVENNLTELVQVLFRGRDKKGDQTLEDGKRKVVFLFPIDEKNYLRSKTRALEIANLIKASLLTVTCGGSKVITPSGEKVLKIVPIGLQRERVFHPLKEVDRRLGNPLKVLNQLLKIIPDRDEKDKELKGLIVSLKEELKEFYRKIGFNLPPNGLRNLLKLLGEAEKINTLGEALNMEYPKGNKTEILTVKGHNLIFGVSILRTELKIDKQKRGKMLALLRKIEEKAPVHAKRLKLLKDFLLKGREKHIDLKASDTERILIVPPLGWEFENFDPLEVIDFDIVSYLRNVLYSFVGSTGNFYPEREQTYNRPFGITDLDKYLFDEINKDFLKSGNVMLSSEVNLMELLV